MCKQRVVNLTAKLYYSYSNAVTSTTTTTGVAVATYVSYYVM